MIDEREREKYVERDREMRGNGERLEERERREREIYSGREKRQTE
jgi:hypothetical protein